MGLDSLRSRILAGDPAVVRALAELFGPLREQIAAGNLAATLQALRALQTAGAGKLPEKVDEAATHVAFRMAAERDLTGDEATLVAMALRVSCASA